MVAMMVVLVPAAERELQLGAEAVEDLRRAGVTQVSLVRDAGEVGVVLDGWAFDPVGTDAALGALGVEEGGARTLQPVMHMAVSAAAKERGIP